MLGRLVLLLALAVGFVSADLPKIFGHSVIAHGYDAVTGNRTNVPLVELTYKKGKTWFNHVASPGAPEEFVFPDQVSVMDTPEALELNLTDVMRDVYEYQYHYEYRKKSRGFLGFKSKSTHIKKYRAKYYDKLETLAQMFKFFTYFQMRTLPLPPPRLHPMIERGLNRLPPYPGFRAPLDSFTVIEELRASLKGVTWGNADQERAMWRALLLEGGADHGLTAEHFTGGYTSLEAVAAARDKWVHFLQDVGTHYTKSVRMGGYVEGELWFHRCILVNYGYDYCMKQSGWSFLGLIGDRKGYRGYSQKVDSKFHDHSELTVNLHGGDPKRWKPEDWPKWVETISSNMAPVFEDLSLISDLVRDSHKRSQLGMAIEDYGAGAQRELRKEIDGLEPTSPVQWPKWCKKPRGS